MNKLKYFLKGFLLYLIPTLISIIVFSTLNYFDIIGFKMVYILSFISIVINYFLSGFYLAKKSDNKGILRGLVMGSVNVIVTVIIALIFAKLSIACLVYFTILILSSITGGVIGINYKDK